MTYFHTKDKLVNSDKISYLQITQGLDKYYIIAVMDNTNEIEIDVFNSLDDAEDELCELETYLNKENSIDSLRISLIENLKEINQQIGYLS